MVRVVRVVLASLVGAWLLWRAPVAAAYGDLALAMPVLVAVAALAAIFVGRARPAWRLPSAVAGDAALVIAVLLLEGAIAGAWSASRSHGALIGGRIPYSDAADYLSGAGRLLHAGALDEWNSRRPLNASLFAVRLALAGESLLGALHLQAALLALCTWLAARSVARDLGWRAGTIVLGGTLVFGSIFAPTTMSECLGLSLGALAFATLWSAARTRAPVDLAVGGALLAAALSARSGPFVVLVTVMAWAAYLHRREGVAKAARGAAYFAGGVLAGLQVTRLLLAVHHGVGAGAQSNFSYTLYGLAHGGVGWERAWSDHPAIAAMGDARGAAFINALAVAQIKAHPLTFVLGLWRNVECLAFSWTEQLSGDALAHRPALQWIAFAALMGAIAWAVRRAWRRTEADPALALCAAVFAGMGLSVPVIYMDGRERVFAAAFPGALALISAIVATRREGDATDVARAPRALGLALLALAVVGPRVGHAVTRVAPAPTEPCPDGASAFATVIHPGTPRVFIGRGSDRSAVGLRAFRLAIGRDPNLGTNGLGAALAALPEGATVLGAFDDARGALCYLVFDVAPPTRAVLRGCARPMSDGARPLRRVVTVASSR
jgi:hypothetical protein